MWFDILNTAILIGFVGGFCFLGFAFLRKKRQERIAELTEALSAPREGWLTRWTQLISGRTSVDEAFLTELESTLLRADVGIRTTQKLLDALRNSGVSDPTQVQAILKREMRSLLKEPPAINWASPTVIMFVGVNGVGKTTSIGKVAQRFKNEGKSVLLGAGDTFRAAAADQLGIWAERTNTPIVSGAEQADPASVLFDAVTQAKNQNLDVVLCDTAGRLHTKVNLMSELEKVHRVIGKACPGAPHEVWLVLDATMGQNAIVQAKQFSEATPLTGIVLNKLDGTAKGGIVIAVANELNIPIRYIGVGEKVEDLRPFDPDEFVNTIF